MRIICAMITQHRLSTGIASVATRNSGTDTTPTAVVEATRSNHEPRHTAEAMPSVSAIGTENSAVTAASSSELGRRLATSSPTGICVVAEVPRSPLKRPPSQCA